MATNTYSLLKNKKIGGGVVVGGQEIGLKESAEYVSMSALSLLYTVLS